MMDPERTLLMYADVLAPGRRRFDRWLNANAILGSILAAVIFAMAIAGLDAPPSGRTVAQATGNMDALRALYEGPDVGSPHDSATRLAPYRFPAQDADQPF